jgi:hypothetical protein
LILLSFERKELLLSLAFIFLGLFSVYTFFEYTGLNLEETALYTISFTLIFTPYVFFGTSFFKNFLKTKFSSIDSAYFGFSLYLFLSYLVVNYRFFDWKLALIFSVYFIVPYIVLRFLRKENEKFDFYILLVLLIIALPIDLQLLPKDYSFSKLVIVDLTFFLFLVIADIKDIGYTWDLKFNDIKIALAGLAVFILTAVPFAFYTGFISFHPSELSVERVIVSMMVIFFFVAIPEEFFFRGIVQNLLEKSFKDRTKYAPVFAILITSFLFGISHFYKGDWRYVLLAVLGGIVNGFIYYKTKKITASALTHLIVDFVWSSFFITNWQS